jgi:hypothetical protein
VSEPSSSDPEPVDPAASTPSVPAQARRRVEPRTGDADCDRAVEFLREHLAQGRLDAVEFDERMGRALQAKTSSEIIPLFADLPEPRPSTIVEPVAFQAPPWQRQSAPVAPSVPRPRSVASARRPPSPGLAIAASIAWPVTILLITFGLNWAQYWWLVFIPIVLSSLASKDRHSDPHGPGRH